MAWRCWDHAVWATASDCLAGKKCVIRLHSIEALQTRFPADVDWSRVDRLITVGEDITDVLLGNHPSIASHVRPTSSPMASIWTTCRGVGDRHRIAWVGHLEPKKNPMLLLQIAHTAASAPTRAIVVGVAGAFTRPGTALCVSALCVPSVLGPGRAV